MKLIEPSVEYMHQDFGLDGMCEHIERCARTCYKSEHNSKEGEAVNFVNKLVNSKHLSMLEHGTVYLQHSSSETDKIDDLYNRYSNNSYSKVHRTGGGGFSNSIWITTNYRVIVENMWNDDLKYFHEVPGRGDERYTLKFITDIGIAREILRHRKFSFANESTRYCNYSKDKFGNELVFIRPQHIPSAEKIQDGSIRDTDYECAGLLQAAEVAYLDLIKAGWSPQEARCVLPLATKSELVVTGYKEDWDYFFALRLYESTGKVHPDMKYIAKLALEELESKTGYRYPREEVNLDEIDFGHDEETDRTDV